jgi:thiosulfate reductase cytochrome b subunit
MKPIWWTAPTLQMNLCNYGLILDLITGSSLMFLLCIFHRTTMWMLTPNIISFDLIKEIYLHVKLNKESNILLFPLFVSLAHFLIAAILVVARSQFSKIENLSEILLISLVPAFLDILMISSIQIIVRFQAPDESEIYQGSLGNSFYYLVPNTFVLWLGGVAGWLIVRACN